MFTPTNGKVATEVKFPGGVSAFVHGIVNNGEVDDYITYVLERAPGIYQFGENTVIAFSPDGGRADEADTYVAARSEIETKVVIAPSVQIGEDTVVRSEAHIEPRCTLADRVDVGEGADIGSDNHFPEGTIIAAGISIPPQIFARGDLKPSTTIDQTFLDSWKTPALGLA